MAAIAWSTTDLSPSGVWAFASLDTVATETTTSAASIRATFGKSTGKWYWEVQVTASTTFDAFVGVLSSAAAVTSINGGSYSMRANGAVAGLTTGTTFVSGDVIGIALDADAGKLWLRKNGGAWLGGGDPTAGSIPTGTGLASGTTWVPAAGSDNNAANHQFTIRGTSASFGTSAPTGFGPISETFTLSGTVVDATGTPVARTVRAYARSTGALASSTTSDAGTGAFSVTVAGAEAHYVIALDADVGTLNALIYDRVIPVVG